MRVSNITSTKKWISMPLVGGLLFALVAFVYASLSEPIYRSQTVLLPVTSEDSSIGQSLGGGLGGIASIAGFNLGQSDSLQVESLAVLTSRQFIGSFVEKESLRSQIFPGQSRNDDSASNGEQPTINDAYELFMDDVMSVSKDTVTGLVTLTVDWKDPDLAAQWANELVSMINSHMRDREREDALNSKQYLENELAKTSVLGVQNLITRLLEKQVNRIMLTNVREEFAYRVIDAAVPADTNNPERPKTLLLVCAGFAFGVLLLLGILMAMDARLVGRERSGSMQV